MAASERHGAATCRSLSTAGRLPALSRPPADKMPVGCGMTGMQLPDYQGFAAQILNRYRFIPPAAAAAQRSIRDPQRASGRRVSKDDLASRAVGRLRADLIRRGGPGTPLDPALRSRLERHLAFDLASARLHHGPAAATAAAELDAGAFTISRDVFLGDGMYPPETAEAIGVLAHELTHVGQQTQWGGTPALQ